MMNATTIAVLSHFIYKLTWTCTNYKTVYRNQYDTHYAQDSLMHKCYKTGEEVCLFVLDHNRLFRALRLHRNEDIKLISYKNVKSFKKLKSPYRSVKGDFFLNLSLHGRVLGSWITTLQTYLLHHFVSTVAVIFKLITS